MGIKKSSTVFSTKKRKTYLRMLSEPMNQLQVRRDCLGAIVSNFASHKILLPYAQLDVHQK